MENIKLKIYGKINLTLDIVDKIPDGYHKLDSIMASVNAYDVLSMQKADDVVVFMDGELQTEKNTAYKTLILCKEHFGVGGHVEITKGIPNSAGMGGSSADASGVLYAVNKLYGVPVAELMVIASKVGSDVAFMYFGGIKRCMGRGEILTDLEFFTLNLVLIKPKSGANTKEVFNCYDTKCAKRTRQTKYLLESLKNLRNISVFFSNALQEAAVKVNPEIQDSLDSLKQFCEVVVMTGSGSAVYGITPSRIEAEAIAHLLRDKFDVTLALTTQENGIEEIVNN